MIYDISMLPKYCFGHTAKVTSVEFSSTGDKMVTGSEDGTAKIWDAETGALIHTLPGHAGWVVSAAFNLAGKKILSLASQDAAKIWNAETGDLIQTLSGHTGTVMSATFNQSGTKVITNSDDGTTKTWYVENDALQSTTETSVSDEVLSDSDMAYDGSAKIWNTITIGLLLSAGPTSFSCSGGNKLAIVANITPTIWNLEPHLSIERFLSNDITCLQAVIVNAIYETIKARGIVRALKKDAFVSGAPIVSPEDIKFKFNSSSKLWSAYQELPDAIRRFLDPYVTQQ
jgi:WD40 repeat protein